jgi:hypothetical protein
MRYRYIVRYMTAQIEALYGKSIPYEISMGKVWLKYTVCFFSTSHTFPVILANVHWLKVKQIRNDHIAEPKSQDAWNYELSPEHGVWHWSPGWGYPKSRAWTVDPSCQYSKLTRSWSGSVFGSGAQNFSYSYVRNNLVRTISWQKQTNQSGPFYFTPNIIGQCQSADRPY